jgi:hypothetical protein
MLFFFADLRVPIPVHSLAFFFVHHFKDFEKKMENVGQPPPPLCENSVSTSSLAMSVRALFLEIS